MLHSRVSPWPYRQTLDYAGKACHGQTLKLIGKIHNESRKSFIVQAPVLVFTKQLTNFFRSNFDMGAPYPNSDQDI